MIYMEPSRLGYRNTLIVSWMNKQDSLDDDSKMLLETMMDWLIPPCLDFVRRECVEIAKTSDSNLVTSCLNVLECLFKECHDSNPKIVQGFMLFATVWTIGASVNEAGRPKFDAHFKSVVMNNERYRKPQGFELKVSLPEGFVYDFLFESSGEWKPWLETATKVFRIAPKTKYDNILVPTVDTMRYSHLLKLLCRHSKQVMFVGPTGTGKSVYIRDVLMNGGMNKEVYVPVFINFSAQTSAFQTQEILESKLDKRRKGVFGPPLGKKCIIFVDDLNMPAKEQYGAQPPVELLRYI
jgi:dynein heavy chain, axonemal